MPFFYKFFSIMNAAIKRNQVFCVLPFSKRIVQVLCVLRNEGFIHNFSVDCGSIRVFFKYQQRRPVLKQFFLVSKPGRRVYSTVSDISLLTQKATKPSTHQSFLFLIDSQLGLLTHYQALKLRIGGELLCRIAI